MRRLLCLLGLHRWGSIEYTEPAYIAPQGFFTRGDGGFPLASVVNESKGQYFDDNKCAHCGKVRR